MESTLLAYLRLFSCDALSPLLFARLLQHFASVGALSGASDEALLACGLEAPQIDALHQSLAAGMNPELERSLHWQKRDHHHLLCFEDPDYPPLLRETDVAPPLLFVRGNREALKRTQIAIVGSRRASSYGQRTAFWLGRELGAAGLLVTSGLARGIDTRAHEGALEAESATVAVIGTGVDRIYPPGNERLADKIIERGALVSEFALGTPPLPLNFPRRNRIMSGLSLGTVVVEAAVKSGSLITARLAMEQNREVFAVPGPITSANSAGCHRLLRDGATLVESPSDILEELGWEGTRTKALASGGSGQRRHTVKLGKDHKNLVNLIGCEGCELQWLLEATGLEHQELLEQLLHLEISGQIEARGGRYYRDC